MENKTFAEIISDVEMAVKPHGFMIVEAGIKDRTPVFGGKIEDVPADQVEVRISIVRKGIVG